MKAFFLIMFSMMSVSAFASDLTDKSTYIGTASAPNNPFVVCVVEKAVHSAFGAERAILVYSHSAPVGEARPPEFALVAFVTQKKSDGKRNILRVELRSTDLEKKWQFVRAASGEIFLFSKRVSSQAVLKDASGNTVTSLDISKCQ
jgi:hypothetical protein